MENVVRSNFAGKINSEIFKSIDHKADTAVSNSAISKVYEREADE